MATYCAQNIGAGKIKRIRQGFKSITIMGSIYSVVVAAIIMTVGKYMTYLFLSGDLTEIMHSVDIYLKCVGYFGVCMASPVAWILASALLIVMYYYVIHQNEKRFAKYADEE